MKNVAKCDTWCLGKGNGLNVKELRDMWHLQGRLYISNLGNVANVQDAGDVSLNKMHKLEELGMFQELSQPKLINTLYTWIPTF